MPSNMDNMDTSTIGDPIMNNNLDYNELRGKIHTATERKLVSTSNNFNKGNHHLYL
jgi:hypothetical protein